MANLAVFVHEVAAFSELAFVFFVEDLASSGTVELTIAPGVLGSEFFDAVGEFASILVWTIPFFYKIFAKLHLYLVLPSMIDVSLGEGSAFTLAGLKGVTVFLTILLELVPMKRWVKCRNGV